MFSAYKIGDIGPSGGIIFYDKGSTTNGWRYLEAAPFDLVLIDDTPAINTNKDTEECFPFGYYRKSDYSNNLFVNRTVTYNQADCTATTIGSGKTNTQKIVNAMTNKAYWDTNGSDSTAFYAAKLCEDLIFNGYIDWFLPSKDELNLMYNNLKLNNLGNFGDLYYWSSSEESPNYAWNQGFDDGTQYEDFRYFEASIRPIRAF